MPRPKYSGRRRSTGSHRHSNDNRWQHDKFYQHDDRTIHKTISPQNRRGGRSRYNNRHQSLDRGIKRIQNSGRAWQDTASQFGARVVRQVDNQKFSDAEIAVITEVLSTRYNVEKQMLNLSNIYFDPQLKSHSIKLSLTNFHKCKLITELVVKHIPETKILDLSSNRLMKLDGFSDLVKTSVISLNLMENKLEKVEFLKMISKLPLVEINLDKNPLCETFSDPVAYVGAVHKIFPKVKMLDGHEVEAAAVFDLNEDNSCLPEIKGGHCRDPLAREPIQKFVKDYFSVYDTNNRETLMAAYSDSATFSITISIYPDQNPRPEHSNIFKDSRNILRNSNSDHCMRLLKTKKLSIIAYLAELPQTVHDLNSCVIDVMHVSHQMVIFSVNGLFKEVGSNVILAFSRVFTAQPFNNGLILLNDMLHIRTASNNETMIAFSQHAPTPASSPSMEFDKQSMIQKFSQLSGMTLEYSEMCLVQNNWNFDNAGQDFQIAKAQSKLPPEAFVNYT